MAEVVTAVIQMPLEKLYDGWDKKRDGQCAKHTKYAWVPGHLASKPRAALRILHSRYQGVRVLLPLETGEPCMRIPEKEEPAIEISGFSFADKEAGLTLLRDMTAWTLDRRIKVAYAIFDLQNATTRSLITFWMGFKPLPGITVTFPSFVRRETNEPVAWQVARADRPILRDAKQRLENLLGPSRPIVDLDLGATHHRHHTRRPR
jgi:hypothetical protein